MAYYRRQRSPCHHSASSPHTLPCSRRDAYSSLRSPLHPLSYASAASARSVTMTTSVAASPAAAPHVPSPSSQVATSSKYTPIAASSGSTPPTKSARSSSNQDTPITHSDSCDRGANSSQNSHVPKIFVKKEPVSPDNPASRHRPRRLDVQSPDGSLAMQGVGLACLSPGFQTHDPAMREQLQRSMNVRDRQRQIIEARQKGKTVLPLYEASETARAPNTIADTPVSRRKPRPPDLSILPSPGPDGLVIQSAPPNRSFTGLMDPHLRQVSAQQTTTRLPPISDVIAGEAGCINRGSIHCPQLNNPLPSPGFHQTVHAPVDQPTRRREYKSAEEAVQSMSGGREDLLPRMVHYGGHQPPTPPSPLERQYGAADVGHVPSRRRTRDDYEKGMDTPPLGYQGRRSRPFGEGTDSHETQRRKKEEFISLCGRAWDLFHS